MAENISDLDLIGAIKAGDQSSFEILTNRYAGKVYNLAKRLTKTDEDAEEVLQDVFVTIYKKIKSFEGRSSFSSWLYRIAVNAALMKNRTDSKVQKLPLEEGQALGELSSQPHIQSSTPLDEEASHRELLATLEEAIQLLPEEFRPVYVLRDIDGLSSKEVSKLLKVSIPAVKSRLHRSRFLLRERMEGFYTEYCERYHGSTSEEKLSAER